MSELAIVGVSPDNLNALVKNIMRQTGVSDPNEAVLLVNSGKWVLSKLVSWRKEDWQICPVDPETGKVTHSSVVDSETGKAVRFSVTDPETGEVIEVAVLGDCRFSRYHPDKIIERGETVRMRRGSKLLRPRPGLAELIRKKFTDDDIKGMPFMCIAVLHEFHKADNNEGFSVWAVGPGTGGCWRDFHVSWFNFIRSFSVGFAFEVVEPSSQSQS